MIRNAATTAGRLALMAVTVALVVFLGQPGRACNPEPGPQHFPIPDLQTAPPVVRVGYFEVHSERTGLPCDKIRAVEAFDGFVLVGTEGGGLLLYEDGAWRKFAPRTVPSFPSETVTAIIPGENQGEAVAGTIDGIVHISGLPDKPVFRLEPMASPCSSNVLSLGGKKGTGDGAFTLLCGTNAEVGQVTGGTMLRFSPPNDRQPTGFGAIRPVGDRIWIGCEDGLYSSGGGSMDRFAHPTVDFGWVQALDAGGEELFVGGSLGGWRMKQDTPVEMLPGIWVTALGLTRGCPPQFDGKAFRPFELQGLDTIKDPNQKAVFEIQREFTGLLERYGEFLNRWIGAAAPIDEVNKFRGAFEAVAKKGKALSPAIVIETPLLKGLWVGTQDQGVILFGTDGQKYHFNAENSKLPQNRITAISSREDGETWIGTYDGGLLHYTRLTVPPGRKPEKIWEGRPTLIRLLSDRLFIGTEDQGLTVLDPRSREVVAQFTPANLSGFHQKVTGIGMDEDSRLWVGGDHGVWRQADGAWTRFGKQQGLPDEAIRCLEVDAAGRVYAAGGEARTVAGQVAMFNGQEFTTYHADLVARLLQMPPDAREAALRKLGLKGTYLRDFDVTNATAALALFDRTASASQVVAMEGIPQYLLLGGAEGDQSIFDGEGFKPLSPQGTGGPLERIVRLQRRQNGDLFILGKRKLFTFNGEHYREVPDVGSLAVKEFTDLALDSRNPDLCWVSYKGHGDGGCAVYLEPLWREIDSPDPVISLTHGDPFLFFATPDAVYRLLAQ
ncbi:MAG: hypothetical protein GX442_10535 [Candidatus Riflebacteria bacterium]|nr:hypothetical protein [Candidatus Riflebacteria bacterium]